MVSWPEKFEQVVDPGIVTDPADYLDALVGQYLVLPVADWGQEMVEKRSPVLIRKVGADVDGAAGSVWMLGNDGAAGLVGCGVNAKAGGFAGQQLAPGVIGGDNGTSSGYCILPQKAAPGVIGNSSIDRHPVTGVWPQVLAAQMEFQAGAAGLKYRLTSWTVTPNLRQIGWQRTGVTYVVLIFHAG